MENLVYILFRCEPVESGSGYVELRDVIEVFSSHEQAKMRAMELQENARRDPLLKYSEVYYEVEGHDVL